MPRPAVSVVMPVFNEPVRLLGEAVDSIFAQDFSSWELVVVDDGSSNPETLHYLDALSRRDSRVRLLRTVNRGQTSALLRGIEASSAEVIARQDADDISLPSRLGRQWAALQENPALALVGCRYQYITEEGQRLHVAPLPLTTEAIRAAFPQSNPFGHGTVMFRRQPGERAGSYRAYFRHCQDYDFFWRLSQQSACVNLSSADYLYRLRRGSQSFEKQESFLHEVYVARCLAEQRARNGVENLAEAVACAEMQCARFGARREVWIRRGDQLMLNHAEREALSCYFHAIVRGSVLAAAKAARCMAWWAVPSLRARLFRSAPDTP